MLKLKAISLLAFIMSLRMLGLFMIMPVFSLVALHIPGATPFLIGFTLGVYGLTQAIFQAPLGFLSDFYGRRKVIFLGLCIFVIGSLIAALAHSLTGIIIGRALQGAGAIGSVVMALVADLTSEKDRSPAMAIIGLSIGASFLLAFVLGPIINAHFQLAGIFWFCAFMGLLALVFLLQIPKVKSEKPVQQKISLLLKQANLSSLYLGIFSLHAIFTALFIWIPLVLGTHLNLNTHQQVIFYLMVMLLAFGIAFPLIRFSEKHSLLKPFFIIGVFLILLAPLSLALHSFWTIPLGLLLFFSAFTFLEAVIPSLLSKMAPSHLKGSVMGLYSTSQYLGIFTGGFLGGLLFQKWQTAGLLSFCFFLGLIWLFVCLWQNYELQETQEAGTL